MYIAGVWVQPLQRFVAQRHHWAYLAQQPQKAKESPLKFSVYLRSFARWNISAFTGVLKHEIRRRFSKTTALQNDRKSHYKIKSPDANYRDPDSIFTASVKHDSFWFHSLIVPFFICSERQETGNWTAKECSQAFRKTAVASHKLFTTNVGGRCLLWGAYILEGDTTWGRMCSYRTTHCHCFATPQSHLSQSNGIEVVILRVFFFFLERCYSIWSFSQSVPLRTRCSSMHWNWSVNEFLSLAKYVPVLLRGLLLQKLAQSNTWTVDAIVTSSSFTCHIIRL